MAAVEDEEVAARASALLDLGRTDDALALLGPAVASSGSARMYALFVAALSHAGRPTEAAPAATHAMSEVGPDPDLARIATYAFLAVGDRAAAVTTASAAVQLAPHWVPALLALALAEGAGGGLPGLDRAGEAVGEALRLGPDLPAVHSLAGEIAVLRRRWRQAREHYRAALRLDPLDTEALTGLGRLEEKRSRYGRAARWYAQALTNQPGNPFLAARVRGLLGQILGVVGAVSMLLSVLVFIMFATQADPQPGKAPPSALATILITLAGAAGVGLLVWTSLRAIPRVAVSALRSDVRVYRRPRRCFRRTIAQLVLLAATIVAAVFPVGSPPSRLGWVVSIWLAGMVLSIVNVIGIRLAFGFGGGRPASR